MIGVDILHVSITPNVSTGQGRAGKPRLCVMIPPERMSQNATMRAENLGGVVANEGRFVASDQTRAEDSKIA